MKRKRLARLAKLLVLISVSICLMIVDEKSTSLRQFRSFVSVVALPFHMAASSPAIFFRWIGGDLYDWNKLNKEYQNLQREHLILRARIQQLETLEYENDRLRNITSSAERISYEVMFGQVVEIGVDLYENAALVNRGTVDGVYVGQTVLDSNGVVGQVRRVGALESLIMLVTDTSLGVPVKVARTGLHTILYGSGREGLVTAPFLESTVDVVEGDVFVTSGLASSYIAGYPVARVVEIKRDPNLAFLDIRAKPIADLGSLQEILLVWPGANEDISLAPLGSGK
ncbi:MAG: rod shape-determining protein MreC [Acidiferrobacteraceae bacterium]|nr:rod shape-determining protein MreC [Acidiferrobacteraceae bacterium]|tara:strand:+ start:22528 stop:23379 length:852 start_codon:yes stop_codon:yes gene_type:complete